MAQPEIHKIMKTIIAALGFIALALVGTAPKAEARGYRSTVYISGYHCGAPIYKERYFIGYDRCGRPVWGTRIVRTSYRPVVRTRYVAPCPPPVRYRAPYYGNGVVIQASFRR